MAVMDLLQAIAEDLASATGRQARCQMLGAVGGGCINRAMRVSHGDNRYFVKLNSGERLDMFAAEAQGLLELRRAEALYAPEPVCWGRGGKAAWLVLEDLELGGPPRPSRLGEGLAALHRVTQPRFGWRLDNTIGSTAQKNTEQEDWLGFWREQRLGYQLELATVNGAGERLASRGQELLESFPKLFAEYRPEASLLHGDLWSGNYAYLGDGQPVIYDPAVYYGDREAELAMTELFGGFPHEFYAAYEAAWPLDAGYRVRRTLYQLYHVLNHFNLFGGAYLNQALSLTDGLLAELR